MSLLFTVHQRCTYNENNEIDLVEERPLAEKIRAFSESRARNRCNYERVRTLSAERTDNWIENVWTRLARQSLPLTLRDFPSSPLFASLDEIALSFLSSPALTTIFFITDSESTLRNFVEFRKSVIKLRRVRILWTRYNSFRIFRILFFLFRFDETSLVCK